MTILRQCLVVLLIVGGNCFAQAPRLTLPGVVPAAAERLTAIGGLPGTNRLHLAFALPLRNTAELNDLLQQLYSPGSTNFHKFLAPDEFSARFGPTEQDYEAVKTFAKQNGLIIAGEHPNRLVLDVEGNAVSLERAFLINLRLYKHPTQPRNFYAPDREPSVPAHLSVADIWGLSDYYRPVPLSHRVDAAHITPLNYSGSGPSGSYQGRDFRNAYSPGTSLRGTGQIAAVAEFDGYYANDISTYAANSGYTNVPLQNVLLNGVSGTPGYSGLADAVAEVSLDIELIIAMAPGLSRLMVYEGSNPYDVFNRIVTDNLAKQISCSWSWGTGPTHNWGRPGRTLDSQFQQMAAQGQSFFQASGDSDAYSGRQAISSSAGPIPVDSPYVTSVGGTTLTMSGAGADWASETVWNWGNNTGSGGGISSNYTIPSWQTSVGMSLNNGSTQYRNFPDVALTADAVYVVYNNGATGFFGGTSCAAPLWAGFTAMVNEQAAAVSGTSVGFLNPALYGLASGPNYASCFHDITTGNNIGTNTPGLYNAVPNYDLATGLGTPNGTNLINALAPFIAPFFISQPSSQTVTNGGVATFSATANGQSPLTYRWLFNGTNLPGAANISGTTSNVLTITSASSANAGSYQLVATNTSGSATSSVATLTVTFPPAFTSQPTNQTVLAGGNANFTATVSGAGPISYQWRQNGTNLSNGGNVVGANSNFLALTAVASGNAGNYSLVATNVYGAATSIVATLTVTQPAAITAPPVAQVVQCGSNALFTVGATGTAPLTYHWSLDGTALSGATTTALLLNNVHLPNHTVAVVVTNLYGSSSASVALGVQDTLAPAISLNGANPIYIELGNTFSDPGATATDLCAGTVSVAVTGTVNTNAVGTNTVVYSAGDGNGNTNTTTRMVVVRDTTSPAIQWSFTNLTLAADSACSVILTNLTGTNYILASDLSKPLTITQSPTNGTTLGLGAHTVVLTVTDPYGNAAYSTNTVNVQDQTPPVLILNGGNSIDTELGTPFADPGASAPDACAGVVPVTVSGTVNTSVVGSNTLVYTASDGHGNTNSAIRTVVVRDTTPPTIQRTFTNVVLAAGAACTAALMDLTGTNYIQVADLSGPLSITQNPTNGTVLPLGIHSVVLRVLDAYGNAAYSTNTVLVQDQTPPSVTLNGAGFIEVQLGTGFTDPGASAFDSCAGIVPVQVSETVNSNVVGTNTLLYTADDGNGNTNSATRVVVVRDTTPPRIEWSFTNLVIAADTNCSGRLPDLTGTNYIFASDSSFPLTITQAPTNGTVLPLGTYTVVLTVADAYGNAAYSTNTVLVRDQTSPVITLNGANPTFLEVGTDFIDPGASAYDACAGIVPVTVSGTVNSGAVGTNTLVYLASDGNGNAGTVTRSVMVNDTTPPVIVWCFTNLVLALDTNCSAILPDLTETNYVLATDLSEPLTVTQSPTNGTMLSLGSHIVVLKVMDAYGNAVYSTNTVLVQDQTPPLVAMQPQNHTNVVGDDVSFSVGSTACTPVSYQWFFNQAALNGRTNNPLLLSGVTSMSSGSYYAVCTAAGGSSTSSVAILKVNPRASSLALTSSENPSGLGDNLIFSAAVTPTNASGTIQFFTNSVALEPVPLLGGVVMATNISSLPRGTNVVAAVYSGDTDNLPCTNSLAQIVTNHPPTAAAVFLARGAGMPLEIALTSLAGYWEDVDGDVITLAGIEVSANGVTVTNNGGTLFYANANNVPDLFGCLITDGWGATNVQMVNISVVTAAILGVSATNNGIMLDLSGTPGFTYVLQATTNLAPAVWLPLYTNTLGTNSFWRFNDPEAPDFTQRFYRLKIQQ